MGRAGNPAVAGAKNLLIVTLRANKALDACHTALYKPGAAIQAAWITHARSLAAFPWRAPSPCFDAAFLFDGLRGKGVQILKKDPATTGSGFLQFDLGTAYRIDVFRVTGTKGTGATGSAHAKLVRLSWAEVATAADAEWKVAGSLVLPFDADAIPSVRFAAVSSRYWRLEAVSNHENFQLYPYSNIQEFEIYACADSESTRINVSNLTGSVIPNHPKMPLENLVAQSPTSLVPSAVWTQSTVELTLKVDYMAQAFDEISFGIYFDYPPLTAPQAPRKISIVTSGRVVLPRSQVFGNVMKIASASTCVQPTNTPILQPIEIQQEEGEGDVPIF